MPISSANRSRGILLVFLYIAFFRSACSFVPPRSHMTTPSSLEVAQFSGEAVSLFNNMKLPASILAGALVPLGMMAPLPIKGKEQESKVQKRLRRLYYVTAVFSLVSQLVSVMWATVAVNKLIETKIDPAASVWALLKRDFDLAWSGTNAHFVAGMLGFMLLIGIRSYFQAGFGLLGRSLAGLSSSGLLLMVAIVNRGVESGGGDGLRYGGSAMHLVAHYVTLLFRQASNTKKLGVLEMASLLGLAVFSVQAVRALFQEGSES